jgi:hypothetical protein
MYTRIATPNGITVFVDGQPYYVTEEHPKFERILEIVENTDESETLEEFMSIVKPPSEHELKTSVNGPLVYENEKIYFREGEYNEELEPRLCQEIEMLNRRGMSLEPVVNFCRNMVQNPSYDSRQRMFSFLNNEGLPITPDGHFLAYKYVRDDFYDAHSGTVLYEIGTSVKMNRRDCDDNPNNSCSTGLHVGGLDYASYGPKTLVLKVNPKDVVTVPYNESQKMRTCEVFVVKEYERPMTEGLYDDNAKEISDDKWYPCDIDDCEEGDLVRFKWGSFEYIGYIDDNDYESEDFGVILHEDDDSYDEADDNYCGVPKDEITELEYKS